MRDFRYLSVRSRRRTKPSGLGSSRLSASLQQVSVRNFASEMDRRGLPLCRRIRDSPSLPKSRRSGFANRDSRRLLMQLTQALNSAKFRTKGLALRRREKRDAEDLCIMFGQPLCRLGSIIDPYNSAADLQAWLDSLDGHFDTVATVGARAIGMGGLFLGAGNQSHVGTISLFIHDDFHNRGIGTLILSVLLSAADTMIGLRRVQLQVFCDNVGAISLYRRFGFEIDGRHECFARRGDALLPVYSMARLNLGQIPAPRGNTQVSPPCAVPQGFQVRSAEHER